MQKEIPKTKYKKGFWSNEVEVIFGSDIAKFFNKNYKNINEDF